MIQTLVQLIVDRLLELEYTSISNKTHLLSLIMHIYTVSNKINAPLLQMWEHLGPPEKQTALPPALVF